MARTTANQLKDKLDQPSRGSSMWVVWLLSIVTFFGTVVVVLLLFWGGRWVVHKFQDRNKKTANTTQPQAQSSNTQQGQSKSQNGSSNNASNSSSPSNPSTPSAAAPGAATTPHSTTPSTGPTTPESGNLVNTGPDGDY